MTDAKAALRRRLRACPGGGDSLALNRNLLGHPWLAAAGSVMAYMAMPTEPDLSLCLRELKGMGKQLLLPRCEAGDTLTARRVERLEDLVPGAFGIPEPGEDLPAVEPEDIDLILVPGMAFDRRGGRLGRGKGYYDRFLAAARARTIGICYQENLLAIIPMDGHDRPVDGIVTDREIIFCGSEGNAK